MKIAFLISLLSFYTLGMAAEHFVENIELSQDANSIYYYSNQALDDGIFINNKQNKQVINQPFENQINNSIVPARITCDQNIQIKESLFTKTGRDFEFNTTSQEQDYGKVKIKLTSPHTECKINFKLEDGSFKTIIVQPFNKIIPNILENNYQNISEQSEIIGDGIDSINKRIEILTGMKISRDLIEARNPKLDLDFSQMPKYDFIVFATLQFNNDFISNIVFKSLAKHAQNNTPVAVLVNTLLIGEKERKLLNWLKLQSTNIKVFEYSYHAENFKIGNKIDEIHRVSHVKLLATFSKTNPKLNHIISGGRNNSDRYFFKDFKKFTDKQYTQFDKEIANKWAQFYDMDFYLNSTKASISIISQMLSFLKIRQSDKTESLIYKNFEFDISVPFRSNEKELENKFVDLINKSKESILILTPYIYFTEKIDLAFKNASNRGVKIIIITSSSLLGDDMTKMVKSIYDQYASFRKDQIEIYSYTSNNNTVMHRKAMLIDNDYLVLGSVNLSKRSFYHDIEITCQITEKSMINQFREIFNSQLKNSHTPSLSDVDDLIVDNLIDLFNSDDIL